MSLEYDDYLNQHILNVVNASDWIRQNIGLDVNSFDISSNVFIHDDSKYSKEEYDSYDAYFYGGKRTKEIKDNFNYAWLHHIHNNPHHWQYWVLINDDPNNGTVALDIPYKYVVEMICDWWSFSWSNDNLYEIFDWYDKHKDYMILSKNTRELVEDILSQIKKKLDEKKINKLTSKKEE